MIMMAVVVVSRVVIIIKTQEVGIVVVTVQLPSSDIGLTFARVAANGPCVITSVLDNIQAVQSFLSVSNEEEGTTKSHKKKNAHFTIAPWSTGGESPMPIMVLSLKLGMPKSVSTRV